MYVGVGVCAWVCVLVCVWGGGGGWALLEMTAALLDVNFFIPTLWSLVLSGVCRRQQKLLLKTIEEAKDKGN